MPLWIPASSRKLDLETGQAGKNIRNLPQNSQRFSLCHYQTRTRYLAAIKLSMPKSVHLKCDYGKYMLFPQLHWKIVHVVPLLWRGWGLFIFSSSSSSFLYFIFSLITSNSKSKQPLLIAQVTNSKMVKKKKKSMYLTFTIFILGGGIYLKR